MTENGNPYRAPQAPSRRAARSPARRWLWWAYLAAHFVAFVLSMLSSRRSIQGNYQLLELSVIDGESLAAGFSRPVAGLVDIYLWRLARTSKAYARLALADSLMTALQLYVLLLPAVAP